MLTFEAYRGTAAVYGSTRRCAWTAIAPDVWFGDAISARDEGTALTVLENAIVTQLEGADFARHDAEVTVDVREGATGCRAVRAAVPARRLRPRARPRIAAARVLVVRGRLDRVRRRPRSGRRTSGPSPAITAVAVIGLLLPHLLAVIAVIVAGFAGRSGNGTRTMVLALARVRLGAAARRCPSSAPS